MEIYSIQKEDFIPRDKDDYKTGAENRLRWLSDKVGFALKHIAHYSFAPEVIKRNTENFIGVTQVPMGIAGPLKINGSYADGVYYVPFATTEATLVQTYERGMVVISKAGGANVKITKDEISLSPIFVLRDFGEVTKLMDWVGKNFTTIRKAAESTTRHGKLQRIIPYPLGNRLILNFWYTTGDAMGMNMINIATDKASKFILKQSKPLGLSSCNYYLRCNFSSDKKPSFFNLLTGYGKDVTADIIIPRKIVQRYLNTTPEAMYDFWASSLMGSIQAGMIGINAHYANALAAIFIACGQDIAQVVNASIGISGGYVTKEGDVYVFVKAHCLPIGTVGGGTALPTQRECLETMGCYGPNKARKFAEIIAGVLLAGEISICAALASGDFIDAHIAIRTKK